MRITAIDNQSIDPESLAMLQAMYSRSHVSIGQRMRDLGENQDQIKAALSKYYIGYGHASIGDCATVAVFIENVPLSVAKAIQDYALYNGQESSTRYIPFSDQESTADSQKVRDLFGEMIALYSNATEEAIRQISEHTNDNGELFTKGTVRARAFDITRGLLPTGVRTQLSWTTTFRKFYEHCKDMLTHPIAEVRDVAMEVNRQLADLYPSAMPVIQPKRALSPARPEAWYLMPTVNMLAESRVYHVPGGITLRGKDEDSESLSSVAVGGLHSHIRKEEMENMPPVRTPCGAVDRIFEALGTYTVAFDIDYGSYRDIQRHRKCFMRASMPGLHHGVNGWYVERLKDLDKAGGLAIMDQLQVIKDKWHKMSRTLDPVDMIEVTPLMANVQVLMTLDIPQTVYLLELRSKLSVHPSLRHMIHELRERTDIALGDFYKLAELDMDMSADTIYAKRGKDTITKDGVDISPV
jgi:thymidylate synthase ThyX